jgi:hypothetical protein
MRLFWVLNKASSGIFVFLPSSEMIGIQTFALFIRRCSNADNFKTTQQKTPSPLP